MTWSKGSAIKQHIKLCDADGKGIDCPVENCKKCRYDNDRDSHLLTEWKKPETVEGWVEFLQNLDKNHDYQEFLKAFSKVQNIPLSLLKGEK